MRMIIIFNPAARGEKSARFRRHLTELERTCVLRPTTGPGAARQLAAQAVREGFDTLVAAGGDGTLNEVLNGIGDVPEGFERTRLGVLPLGTANVFAREIGFPLRFHAAWRTLCAGREKTIDLPKARYERDGRSEERYFVQLAGAGFDARAVEQVDWALKKKIGYLAYVVSSFQVLCRPQSRIEVTLGGTTAAGELVLVGNGRFYGGSFRVFAGASLTDGKLDALVFPRVTWATAARTVVGLLTGNIGRAAGARPYQADRIELRSALPTPFELDGELVGHLPLTLTLEPRKLRVIVP